MIKEEFLQLFLSSLYEKEILNIFNYTAEHFATSSEEFLQCSDWTIEARLKLTHFKLWGFWLSLIISLIGFTLSLFNLYLILKNK